jgi:hypothetical protein
VVEWVVLGGDGGEGELEKGWEGAVAVVGEGEK